MAMAVTILYKHKLVLEKVWVWQDFGAMPRTQLLMLMKFIDGSCWRSSFQTKMLLDSSWSDKHKDQNYNMFDGFDSYVNLLVFKAKGDTGE